MGVIVLVIGYTAACWKWGAWRRWKEFYPTILYLIIGNLSYSYLFDDYWLWYYQSLFGTTIAGLIIVFLTYPAMVVLYLTHYPSGRLKQVLYIFGWTVASTLIEYITFLLNGINYSHGWNIFYSFATMAGMFSLLRLHHRHPLIVWPISLLCGIAVALLFGLPPAA